MEQRLAHRPHAFEELDRRIATVDGRPNRRRGIQGVLFRRGHAVLRRFDFPWQGRVLAANHANAWWLSLAPVRAIRRLPLQSGCAGLTLFRSAGHGTRGRTALAPFLEARETTAAVRRVPNRTTECCRLGRSKGARCDAERLPATRPGNG